MMKHILILLLLCSGIVMTGQAQTDTALTARARNQAVEMNQAYINGQYDRFIDFMHPRLIELLNGRDTLKMMFKRSFDQGIKTIDMDISPATSILTNDTSMQCVLPIVQETEMFGNRYLTKGCLIGISYDKGNQWCFINVSTNTVADLQRIFPELIAELPLVTQEGPTVIKK